MGYTLASSALPASVTMHGVLLMTWHQTKIALVLGFAGLATVAVVWVLYRMVTRRVVEPPEPAAPFDLPVGESASETARPVDPAVANILARAAAQPGDERSTADLMDGAIRVLTDLGGVSVPALQRKLEIDFAVATELVAKLEAEGYISEPGANGKRKVLPQAFEYVERLGISTGDA